MEGTEGRAKFGQAKMLLCMVDVQSYLKTDVSPEIFDLGFKLAAGLTKELEADGWYSYDAEMEEQIESNNCCVRL